MAFDRSCRTAQPQTACGRSSTESEPQVGDSIGALEPGTRTTRTPTSRTGDRNTRAIGSRSSSRVRIGGEPILCRKSRQEWLATSHRFTMWRDEATYQRLAAIFREPEDPAACRLLLITDSNMPYRYRALIAPQVLGSDAVAPSTRIVPSVPGEHPSVYV